MSAAGRSFTRKTRKGATFADTKGRVSASLSVGAAMSPVNAASGFLLASLFAAFTPIQAQEVNKGSAVLQIFHDHIATYMKLRKNAAADVPKLKPTPSAEELAENKRALAEHMRAARAGATQGAIF